jgi:hypothetical protein
MTKEQIGAVLEGGLTWPPERQQEAAEIPTTIEVQDRSPYRLTDEQAAEVRHRLSAGSPETIPSD